jgi:hypothetical protein
MTENFEHLRHYQVDHLLLLVGGNPLPNAVAGKLLVSPGGTISLIHSDGPQGSFPVAERLKSWFTDQGIRAVRLKGVGESNPSSIFGGVLSELAEIKGQRIGLNYTGGTKAMSVHSYRAVEDWYKECCNRGQRKEVFFSYLDARNLEMVFDPPDSLNGAGVIGEKVILEVILSLEDLLELHGWRLGHEPNQEPLLPKSSAALAGACSQEEGLTDWKNWIDTEFRPHCRNPKNNDWKSRTSLSSLNLNMPTTKTLNAVVQSLQAELKLSNEGLPLTHHAFKNNPKHFCRWLDGIWLEHHTLASLKQLETCLSPIDMAQNIETQEVRFDMDLVVIRGYQLFGFSCSTDEKKALLKTKLFEAYIRAHQLGGDEARVALICTTSAPAGLEHEMKRDVDPEGRIRVFGRQHLAGLVTHLSEWILDQSKGA